MGVTYIPGPPQYGQQQQSTQGLVELAMAVKSFKLQEKDMKRKQAQETANLLMSNPSLLLTQDPKHVEKILKEGYDLNFNDQPPADPKQATQVSPPATPTTGDTPNRGTVNVSPQGITALANSVGGRKGSGKDSAGSGVTGGVASPGTVESMASRARQAADQQYSSLAPMYMGAVDALTMERMKADTIHMIENLKQRATAGDYQAMGRLSVLGGHQVTDSDMRNMIASSNMDPKVINQALDFALGNETDSQKADRYDRTLKNLLGSPNVMDKLTNPTDVATIARSIVYAGKLPEGIQMKPLTLAELNSEAAYEKQLMDQGLDPDFSHVVGRARSLGIDYTTAMPKGFHTLAQRETAVKESEAGSQRIQAQAALINALKNGEKISAELASKKYDILDSRLRTMIEADKAKHSWPQDVKEGLINEVAKEVNLQPEEVKRWYQYVTGGHAFEYHRVPDDDAARRGAGTPGETRMKVKGQKKGFQGSFLDIMNEVFFGPKPGA